jgi:hypothetical protein
MSEQKKSPWLADAAVGATHQTYEIRTVADFFQVPEDRRRICLREFNAWLMLKEQVTSLLCAASASLDADLKPSDLRWETDVFRWNDDGKAVLSVQMKPTQERP